MPVMRIIRSETASALDLLRTGSADEFDGLDAVWR
jgi:hypothetical protein